MINVLILGSSSHIAKGLIYYFEQDKNYKLTTWSRSIDTTTTVYYMFGLKNKYDIIINCIGKGKASTIQSINYDDIVYYNELDKCIINYLKQYKSCFYFNISSWVAGEDIKENHRHYIYATNKKYLEIKHRLLPELNIIDLRIQAYFSRWIDLDSGFLLSDILNHIKNGTKLTLNDDTKKEMNISIPINIYEYIVYIYNKNVCCNYHFNLINNVVKKSDILIYFNIIYSIKSNTPNIIPKQLENEIKEWYKLNGLVQ